MLANKNKINLDDFPSPGDRYSLVECLGTGAFGRVHQASDSEANNKYVAIKSQKLKYRNFVEQEYKVLRNFSNHPNLLDFYRVYKDGDEIWFVMELCEGGSAIDLANGLLLQNRRLAEEHIAYILKEVVKAIIYLHQNKIIHRDIKAQNILLSKEGEVKLIDFGLSHTLQEEMGKTDACLGSPCWMAPEIVTAARDNSEAYDNRVDVWSLGITAIELGDGQPPFHSMNPSRALFQIVTNPPPTLNRPFNWSENYGDFVSECLVKNPEHRPYVVEVLDHPFLEQVPDNNYHLSLEIKSFINDISSKICQLVTETEVAVVGKFVKEGVDNDLKEMRLDDLASLDKITEATVMAELEGRLKTGQFQTFIGDVLLVINSNGEENVHGKEFHEKYNCKSRSDNPPHIYAMADSALQNALHHNVPQKIILSGESGSGKTTNYLHLMNHLLYLGANQNINLERLRGAVKLIHSLTHAATPINKYSTRCLWQTDVRFGDTGKATGVIFGVQMLEKCRVSSVDLFDENYHILYYIFDGLCENNRGEEYHLDGGRSYRYLRCDDNKTRERSVKKYKRILKIFEEFEMSESELDSIFRIISAVINIGEIRFANCDEATVENREFVENVAALLKIEPLRLEWALTNYCLMHKGAAVRRKSTVDEGRDARDVFANTLYTHLVDYIVGVINHKLSFGLAIFGDKYSIKIIDHSGFECFKTNHLPQLFINCLNEQLQYHYLQRVFSWECFDVMEEEIEYRPFRYFDNKKTLDQILSRADGVLSFVDEASKIGHGGNYVTNFIRKTEKDRISASSSHEFSIVHYTGRVFYDSREMPAKNRDFLPPEIIETLRLSDDPIVKTLFTSKLNKMGNLIINLDTNRPMRHNAKNESNQYSQIKKMRTLGNIFKSLSLNVLKELSIGSGSGGTHFVRCIRCNLKGGQKNFNLELIRQQVRALSIVETAKARQSGFPHRIPFAEFLRRYQFLAFDFNENVEVSKDNCRLLLVRLKMEGWAIGKSKVFLKYYNEEFLARLYETQVKKITKIQSILRRFLAKCLMEKRAREAPVKITEEHNEKRRDSKMTEEEAAAIIQKAYRQCTFKKAHPDFDKDYKVLDDETCKFIKPFAQMWKHNSLFHVLVRYAAKRAQDNFNFGQQVHFYNIGAFYELQSCNDRVDLHAIDKKAQSTSWLGEVRLTVVKVPFRLDEIPFYDTSGMTNPLTNTGASGDKDDAWDTPYRWRELVSPKASQEVELLKRDEENLIHLPYIRDPEVPLKTLSKEESDNESPKNDPVVEIQSAKRSPQPIRTKSPITDYKVDLTNSRITTPANKDFDYIKASPLHKPKTADPLTELRALGRNSSAANDDPPFNFQGMLRKTNFQQKRDVVNNQEEVAPKFSLRKTHKENDLLIINGHAIEGKKIRTELAPGIFLEGIEIEL